MWRGLKAYSRIYQACVLLLSVLSTTMSSRLQHPCHILHQVCRVDVIPNVHRITILLTLVTTVTPPIQTEAIQANFETIWYHKHLNLSVMPEIRGCL